MHTPHFPPKFWGGKCILQSEKYGNKLTGKKEFQELIKTGKCFKKEHFLTSGELYGNNFPPPKD